GPERAGVSLPGSAGAGGVHAWPGHAPPRTSRPGNRRPEGGRRACGARRRRRLRRSWRQLAPGHLRREPASTLDAFLRRSSSGTSSHGGCQAGRRTAGPGALPRCGSARGPRSRVDRPFFPPHPEFCVRLTERGLDLLQFGLELRLSAGLPAPAAIGQRCRTACQESVPPLRQRHIGHPVTTTNLRHRSLAAEHAQHQRQLLLSGPLQWFSHAYSLSTPAYLKSPAVSESLTRDKTNPSTHWPKALGTGRLTCRVVISSPDV